MSLPGGQPLTLYSLLFLQLVGGRKLIEQLSIHLHESLEYIVDQRNDGSDCQGEVLRR